MINTEVEAPTDTGANIPPEITTIFDGTKPKVKIVPAKDISRPASKPVTLPIIGTIIKDTTDKIANIPLNTNLQPAGTNSLNLTNTIPGTGTLNVEPETTNTFTANSGSVELAPDVLPYLPNLSKFLSDNLNYPAEARENRISGKVAINFIVDEEGNIIETKIIHSVGFGCDEEALRVIKLMPKWKPGLMHGKPVKVSFNQAITFQLN